ncbi:hypothetical protein BV25DRAFT_1828098 [Artomyces pyxidatus]|uniref:Uncharacterized protein n=1 Tax=Artomyces pyxidatus TaxID=48021 RepID=A0ACB8SV72_9AGAM|nr:hypothetical protein BV25DRAFT_1828098 [Artomyces pyxidatus]
MSRMLPMFPFPLHVPLAAVVLPYVPRASGASQPLFSSLLVTSFHLHAVTSPTPSPLPRSLSQPSPRAPTADGGEFCGMFRRHVEQDLIGSIDMQAAA